MEYTKPIKNNEKVIEHLEWDQISKVPKQSNSNIATGVPVSSNNYCKTAI